MGGSKRQRRDAERSPGGGGGATPDRVEGLDAADLLVHVLETMPGGVFTVDAEGHITAWNQGMEEITGYRAEDVLVEGCHILQGDTCFGGPAAPGDNLCPLFAEDLICGKRCTLRRADGTPVPVLKNARLMRGPDGAVIGGIEAMTDLSTVVDLEAEVVQLRTQASGRSRYRKLVGRHPAMQRLYDLIELAARARSSVLIQGETGTGKELVAHAIHHASPRRNGPFVRVSCAALSETLLESELFGHVRGAFTGAVASRVGRFEAADGGTIFLDEIGDVSPAVQTRLLRVLQEREFERVGDTKPVRVDIRVIAATNRDLLALAGAGAFRQDLYYRLAVIPVPVPALRDRASDVPLLVDWFIDRLNASFRRAIRGVTPEAMRRLVAHPWPGNVRELEHAIEYAFAVNRADVIDESCLPPTIGAAAPGAAAPGAAAPGPAVPMDGAPGRPVAVLGARVSAATVPAGGRKPLDRDRILAALREAGGNRSRAAALLGVSRVTLWKWLKRLDVDGDAFRPTP